MADIIEKRRILRGKDAPEAKMKDIAAFGIAQRITIGKKARSGQMRRSCASAKNAARYSPKNIDG